MMPNSIISEASFENDNKHLDLYRTLKMKLKTFHSKTRVLSLISSVEGEGKTGIALNLCRVLADDNTKVILVDASLRSTTLYDRFSNGLGANAGISGMLEDHQNLNEGIIHSEKKNLDFLLNTKSTSSSTELLESAGFTNLLHELREKYDYVIIDTPAMSTCVDAVIIAKASAGVLFVVEENKASRELIKSNLEFIEKTGTPVLGVILNKTHDSELRK